MDSHWADNWLDDALALLALMIIVAAILLMVALIWDDGVDDMLIHQRCLDAGYTEHWVASDDQAYCTKLVNGNTKVLKLEGNYE